MAKEEFGASPIEEDIQSEADNEAALAQEFLINHCLVGGSEFYNLPPARPYAPAAFNLENIRHEKSLRRHFGGRRKTLAQVFALHSPNVVKDVTRAPGQDRFVERDGQRFLNLWSVPARPWRSKPIDNH